MKIERNSDGSAVVKLSEPVRVGTEEYSRLTVPRIRGKHLFTMPVLERGMSLGAVVKWAADVCEPRGVVEELLPADALKLAQFLVDAVLTSGKSQSTGEQPSG